MPVCSRNADTKLHKHKLLQNIKLIPLKLYLSNHFPARPKHPVLLSLRFLMGEYVLTGAHGRCFLGWDKEKKGHAAPTSSGASQKS